MAVPLLVSTVFFTGAIFGLSYWLEILINLLLGYLPSWLNWLRYLLWPVFAVAGVLIIFYSFSLVTNFIAAPFNGMLAEAVEQLDQQYADLRTDARHRLGDLFDSADYPPSLDNLFDVVWDFPSFEPPDYLRQLSPELYAQECQRVQARFDEAVQLAEQAFTDELANLVSHLTDRLAGKHRTAIPA